MIKMSSCAKSEWACQTRFFASLRMTYRRYFQVKSYYVYILTNWNNKVMYVGTTNNLIRRVHEHKNKLVKGFTEKYNVNKLVYFEETRDVIAAITREKEIKKWRREKKDQLVNRMNPTWKDLKLEGL